jgi:hypothetical protein
MYCCWENRGFQWAPRWRAGIGGPTVLYTVDYEGLRQDSEFFEFFLFRNFEPPQNTRGKNFRKDCNASIDGEEFLFE